MSVVHSIIAVFLVLTVSATGFLPLTETTESFGPLWVKKFDIVGNMRPSALDWSPDGRRIALGWDFDPRGTSMNFLNASDGKPVGPVIPVYEALYSMSYSPDGSKIVVGSDYTPATIYSLPEGTSSFTFEGYQFTYSVDWSADGSFIGASARGSDSKPYILVWDAVTGDDLLTLPMEPFPVLLKWSPDGEKLAVSYVNDTYDPPYYGLSIVDASDGSIVQELRGHSRVVWDLAWSPDGGSLATSSGDGTVRIWDVTSGEEVVRALEAYTEEVGSGVKALDWSPDGETLAVVVRNEEAIWESLLLLLETGNFTESGRHRIEWSAKGTGAVRWSPDGSLLAVALQEGWVAMWGDVLVESYTPLLYALIAVVVGALTLTFSYAMYVVRKRRSSRKKEKREQYE